MERIKDQSMLTKILNGRKKAIAYQSYPCGTVQDSYIAECDNSDKDSIIYQMVENVLDVAVKEIDFRRDNKEAAKCIVEGIAQPVYFCAYDFKRVICLEINPGAGSVEYLNKNA